MMQRAVLAMALAASVAAGPVRAAEAVVFPGGTLPARVPTDLSKDNKELRTWVHWEGASVLADPRRPDSDVRKVVFLEEFFLGGQYQLAGGAEFWLLVRPADPTAGDWTVREHVGWLRKEHALPPVPAGALPQPLKEQPSGIHRKCMLVNRLEEVRRPAAMGNLIAFHDRPDEARKVRVRRALFQIYYLFDETKTHFFLGTAPDFGKPKDALLGWVDKGRVCQWNTREAVEFNKEHIAQREQPALVFQKREELENYLKIRPSLQAVRAGKFQPGPLAIEDLTVKDWKYYQPRFPLVSDEDRKYQSYEPVGGFPIFKVGIIGDVYGANGQPILTANRVSDLQRQVRDLREQVNTIQVVFVIDATFGMDRWFKAGAQAVREIMRTVQNLGGEGADRPRVEFSVNFYRDKEDGKARFEGNAFTDKETAVLDLLEKQRALGGGQPLDAVFYGICRALEPEKGSGRRSKFADNATKILVVIGDDGNDPDDKEHSLEQVCQRLIEAGGRQPIAFFAVSVGDQKESVYRLFTEQAQEISRRLADREQAARARAYKDRRQAMPPELARLVETLAGQTVVSQDPRKVAGAIKERFDLSLREMQIKKKLLRDLETGTLPGADERIALDRDDPLAQTYGVVWQQQFLDLIKSHNLDPLLLAREGVQLFNVGWTAYRDPRESAPAGAPVPATLRHVVLMDKSELKKLEQMLQNVLQHWNPRALEQTWKESLDNIIRGDVRVQRTDSPADLMRLHLGVVVHDIGLLHLTFDQLQRKGALEMSELRAELKKKLDLMEDVLQEQQADYRRMKKDGQWEWVRENVRPRKYWWSNEQDEQTRDQRAWIDRAILP
jgi:hypothetical protein